MVEKKSVLVLLFSLVMLIYLAVPYSMIARYERVLHDGHVYRFRPAPVDPYDAFRGKYIYLNGFNNVIWKDTLTHYGPGDDVYVTVRKNDKGFAYFYDVSKTVPASGDYILTKVDNAYIDHYRQGLCTEVRIKVPFDRYYINEAYAGKAELVYRENSRSRDTSSVYLDVRIHDGTAITEELYFDGIPVRTFIKQRLKEEAVP
ncbi:MAG: GDYXXLXY domain-containing protein [Bacteroidia bacterium]